MFKFFLFGSQYNITKVHKFIQEILIKCLCDRHCSGVRETTMNKSLFLVCFLFKFLFSSLYSNKRDVINKTTNEEDKFHLVIDAMTKVTAE